MGRSILSTSCVQRAFCFGATHTRFKGETPFFFSARPLALGSGRCFRFAISAEVEAEVRFGFRAGNLDGQLGASHVLAEEGVDRLEEDRLPAAYHLRELGIEAGVAVEIELLSIEA